MLAVFESRPQIFLAWRVLRYVQEDNHHYLIVSAALRDGSRLEIRDHSFSDGTRKYAYQWMESDGRLRRRWDQTNHWPDVATFPHHVHVPDQPTPLPSTVTNLEDLMLFLEDWFAE
ncbi:MAG: hypothetical protein KBG20_04750 [Caldilineaceae bacterium]|nr:hypothetical protein [Caldilineaceae bacterium]MBP8106258.1 hypothetical protein [Caldilineaceae bacterium]MBP8121189.1 hypothetical protein [Caldilineaceae bacterium]MBP9071582.1 hypothetical protein [Caldilineaceae bacterium]